MKASKEERLKATEAKLKALIKKLEERLDSQIKKS
jgi:hypothetical protein